MDWWIITGAVAVLLPLILGAAAFVARRAKLAKPSNPDGAACLRAALNEDRYPTGDPMPWTPTPVRESRPAPRPTTGRPVRRADDEWTGSDLLFPEPFARPPAPMFDKPDPVDTDSGRTGHVTHSDHGYTSSHHDTGSSSSDSGGSSYGGSSGSSYSGGSDSGSSGGYSGGGDSGGGGSW